jgi:hypothetical protein
MNDEQQGSLSGVDRRGLLRASGILAAGAAVLAVQAAPTASFALGCRDRFLSPTESD